MEWGSVNDEFLVRRAQRVVQTIDMCLLNRWFIGIYATVTCFLCSSLNQTKSSGIKLFSCFPFRRLEKPVRLQDKDLPVSFLQGQ